LTENLVQSKQAAKDLTQPNNSVVFFFFFWECLECFGRQNNTKELQLWKRQNQNFPDSSNCINSNNKIF
jgi:hypothetical protein